jgi:hypothetical protein
MGEVADALWKLAAPLPKDIHKAKISSDDGNSSNALLRAIIT